MPWRWWVVAGGGLVLLALTVGGTPVRSQAPFPDGAFVRAQDGSAWVVSTGRRYAITWTADADNVLPRLPQGPSVATAGQLAAALALPAPTPAPASTAPVLLPPSAPAAPACSATPVTTTEDTGTATVVTTVNYNGVQGLVRQDITLKASPEGEADVTTTTYSIPAWLLAAYGDNLAALMQEIASGRLSNRCAS